jgi:preprotein translocase subunit SecA
MVEEEVEDRLETLEAENNEEGMETFLGWLNAYFPLALKAEDLDSLNTPARQSFVLERIAEAYAQREAIEEKEALVGLERYVIIRSLDRRWQDHLTEMEELRRSVNLRGYGQKDPLNEYKSEAYVFFEELMQNARSEICNSIFRSATSAEAFEKMLSRMATPVQQAGPAQGQPSALAAAAGQQANAPIAGSGQDVSLPKVEPVRRELPKVGRNETVTIRKGADEKQMKFKKAEGLIANEGWELVSK